MAVDGVSLALIPLREAPQAGALLLGIDEEGPLFAVDEDAPLSGEGRPPLVGSGGRRGEPTVEAPGRVALREAVGFLSAGEGGLVAYAAALLNWHRAHRFCANCGAASEVGRAASRARARPAARSTIRAPTRW